MYEYAHCIVCLSLLFVSGRGKASSEYSEREREREGGLETRRRSNWLVHR